MIYGNIEGIRESQLNELERLYGMEFARDEFLPDRLLALLVRFTQALDDFHERVDGVIHFFRRVFLAQAQTQGTVRDFVRQADGQQHVRGIQRAGCAGRAG